MCSPNHEWKLERELKRQRAPRERPCGTRASVGAVPQRVQDAKSAACLNSVCILFYIVLSFMYILRARNLERNPAQNKSGWRALDYMQTLVEGPNRSTRKALVSVVPRPDPDSGSDFESWSSSPPTQPRWVEHRRVE